jgi:hypothetical protein
MTRKTTLATIAAGFTLLVGANSVSAQSRVIYDGSSAQTPSQQGWSYQVGSNQPPYIVTAPLPVQTATNSGTILNSGNNNNVAGYFLKSSIPLDRQKGYTLRFRVKVNSESHLSQNRAGFSVLVVSQPLPGETQPYALELGFWQNNIWAYNLGFTRGENVNFNTTAMQTYDLSVKGTTYRLFLAGSTTPILQGQLRQYTGFQPPLGLPNPYTNPNMIFFGDDTSSATSQFTLGAVVLNTL